MKISTESSSTALESLFTDVEYLILPLRIARCCSTVSRASSPRIMLIRTQHRQPVEYSLRVRHRKHPGRQRERTVAVVMVNGQGHITLSRSLPPTTMLLNKTNILLLRNPTSFNNRDLYESAFAAAKIQQNTGLSRFQSSRRSSPISCSSHQ